MPVPNAWEAVKATNMPTALKITLLFKIIGMAAEPITNLQSRDSKNSSRKDWND